MNDAVWKYITVFFLSIFLFSEIYGNFDTASVQSLLDQARSLTNSNRDSARIFIQQGLDEVKDQAPDFQSKFYCQLGIVEVIEGNYESAITNLQQAKIFSHQSRDSSQLYYILKTIGVVYYYQGKHEQALEVTHQALEGYRLLKDPNGISSSLNNLGINHERLDADSIALQYYLEALAIVKKHDELKSKQSAIAQNIGIIYKNFNQLEKAIPFYRIALNDAVKRNDQFLEIHALGNLVMGKFKLGQIDSALTLGYQHWRLAHLYNMQNEIAMSGVYLGEILNHENRYGESLSYLEESREKAFQTGARDHYRDILLHTVNAHEGQGNYQLALNTMRELDSVKQVMLSEENLNQINALQIQYETAEQERKISQQELEIQSKTNQRNLLIAGLAMVLWFGAFLVLFFWNRSRLTKRIANQEATMQEHRINQLENEKQLLAMSSMLEGQEAERIRIARDLHDGLGGLLSTVKAHFSVIQKEISQLETFNVYDKVNTLIDTASSEVRRISHNMAPHALRLGGLKDALADLCDHLKSHGINVEYQWSGSDDRLEENTEIMLYRVVQELTNNVIKYAQAKNLLIQINLFPNELNLIVEDDGLGFDLNEAQQNAGLGLKSVDSRVHYLNGEMDIESAPGNGTTVGIQVPIL